MCRVYHTPSHRSPIDEIIDVGCRVWRSRACEFAERFSVSKNYASMGSIPNQTDEVERIDTDVFIAGSGPVGCTFARTILDNTKDHIRVCMVDVGAFESSVIGKHQKNDLSHVIDAALQKVSDSDLGTPYSPYYNKHRIEGLNLPNCAVTRTVGGMGTHWTCACPRPEPGEHKNSPIEKKELEDLLKQAEDLLKVKGDQYNSAIRHTTVLECLGKHSEFAGRIRNLPLTVERDDKNKDFPVVTFAGPNTILGKWGEPGNYCTDIKCTSKCRFTLLSEHQVVRLDKFGMWNKIFVTAPEVRNLRGNRTGEPIYAYASQYVIALGAIGTPQVLWNSGFGDRGIYSPEIPALGKYLSEQSLLTCQVILKKELRERIDDKEKKLLPNAEPQVNVKYTDDKPWNGMINHDAYLYGNHKSSFKYDQRFVVDLRFYGKHRVNPSNRVKFSTDPNDVDLYGLPRPTFEVSRSEEDERDDHLMALDMEKAAYALGDYLPGSEPQ
ncbi:unnamed protein product [Rhizoctonia solani]|uniref:Uncharacterized protein n=1 Tax=Rhizoctonia solani TaxID=456999 RepID=A0A8H2WKR5_9AGAM|nr:unnamed protein product [Rhizoctonia solani]